MGNQWGDTYLCVPQPKCWGDVSSRPPIIAAHGLLLHPAAVLLSPSVLVFAILQTFILLTV